MRFEELRRRYPVFRYDTFQLERHSSGLRARFRFSAPPDLSFAPEIHFEPVREGYAPVADDFLNNAVFHLGLIELFSYWKATASPLIEVRAGSLTSDQIRWWEDLLMNGMGEFFYHNDIDFTSRDFVKIAADPKESAGPVYPNALPARSLLTIGGGRDSALAAALFRESGQAFTCMMLNPSTAARNIAALMSAAEPVIIRRSICPELLELNRHGFLNGHTPFSAYLAFLGAVCLFMYGYSNVVVANERSSDEGNVVYSGKEINHQYSKSLRFETLFDEYLRTYLISAGRYFSFLRPLYELQIGKVFANFPEIWGEFRSCNRNRSESWCGACPKCVSVFLTMYPFVSAGALKEIFGSDLLYRDETIPILRQLAGMEVKPFECVATRKEIVIALALAIAKTKQAGEPLPPVLDYAARYIPGVLDTSSASTILDSYGPHRIPEELERILKPRIAQITPMDPSA